MKLTTLGLKGFKELPDKEKYELLVGLQSPGAEIGLAEHEFGMSSIEYDSSVGVPGIPGYEAAQRARSSVLSSEVNLSNAENYSTLYRSVIVFLLSPENNNPVLRDTAQKAKKNLDVLVVRKF